MNACKMCVCTCTDVWVRARMRVTVCVCVYVLLPILPPKADTLTVVSGSGGEAAVKWNS